MLAIDGTAIRMSGLVYISISPWSTGLKERDE